ncbi:uncharacterized protein LOC141856050 [Brevipalpus obovatus]|uniref:uncharacterized protein LOC141856050 n=1 Tax=Brevipalpus obovatus TaxID=246614 RepID=UPI003D9F7DDE
MSSSNVNTNFRCSFLTVLVHLVLLNCVFCSTAIDYRKSWADLERFTIETVNRTAHQLYEDYRPVIDSVQLSPDCRSSLELFAERLKGLELDAIQMVDSWGKIPTAGLLDGKWTDLGAFDECVSLPSTQYCLMAARMPLMPATSSEGFFRQYDVSAFNLTTSILEHFARHAHYFRYLNITTGLCLPKQCDHFEIQTIAQKIANIHRTGLQIDVNLCQSNDDPVPWKLRETVALLVIGSIVLLNILGSIMNRTYLLSEFNFCANIQKLIFTAKTRKPFPPLEGIKSLNMLFMLFGHVLFGLLYPSFGNLLNVPTVGSNPVTILVYLVPFTIDTFFFATGLEMMSHFTLNPDAKFKFLPFLLLRWIRFVVPIGWTICLYILIFSDHARQIIGGPFWYSLQAASSIPETCSRRWLSHIFLVAHFFDSTSETETCLMPDWYLSVDFLLAILFILVLVPYLKSNKSMAIFISLLMIALGCLTVGFIAKVFHVQSTWIAMNYYQEEFVKYLTLIHAKPWSHLAAYFVGVIMAFVLKPSKSILKKDFLLPIWIIWFLMVSSIITYETVINLNLYPISEEIQLIYVMFGKLVWSLSIAWLVYIFHYDLAWSTVRRLLSSKFLRVLSRVNLSALFVNLLVVRVQNATLRSLTEFRVINIFFTLIIPEVVCIYLLAFIFCALIEFPTVNVLKQIFLPPQRVHKVPETITLSNNNEKVFDQNVDGDKPRIV